MARSVIHELRSVDSRMFNATRDTFHVSRITLHEFNTFIAFLALFTLRMSNPFRASGGVAQ